MSRILFACASTALLLVGTNVMAKEGMFTPEQLPQIAEDLKATGLNIPPERLSDLTAFPMGAIVSLGGCSASFVSPKGLAVTNHHCARGSVQYNSTPEHNYLENGFLAKTMNEELPAAPGTRMWVTVAFSDVTEQVLGELDNDMSGRERYDAIEQKQKTLIAECEAEEGYRCSVPAFFEGLEYKLIKQMEIRDVRIAYAPADSIGKYGGDIDNWMWPRHTGDFSFYRAYVGPDGKPADFSKDNVPYQPKHMLKVSAAGLNEGDFVMAVGYPGSTNRYARLATVDYTFGWMYPTYVDLISTWIDTIEDAAPEGSEARIKYESTLAGLNNFLKNTEGQLAGAKRVGLVERREKREKSLNQWLQNAGNKPDLLDAISALDDVSAQQATKSKQNFWYNNITRSQLLAAAQTLYRNAIEQAKPDAEREPGFQERDSSRLEQSMQRIDRRYDAKVDKAVWQKFINMYREQPATAHIDAFDEALGLSGKNDDSSLDATLTSFYENTQLDEAKYRLSLLSANKEELEASNDPFIKLAVALYPTEMKIENDAKALAGRAAALQPKYMRAIIDWQKAQNSLAYPDANSTLRVTYGTVLGGKPKDGLIYEPFTRLEGILKKDTATEPFNSPAKQLRLIEDKKYGPYQLESIGSVPVNFLTDLDSTGGNSGSATLNADAELVGLLFDGTFESVNSDWDFDPKTTRTIHVDTRYMLWVMQYVDNAQNLIDEMTIVK
ncbi:S46 family peptidase [Alteromonas pelagimontana]|uniref:Dipeptidyl-peptidase n=1 Tax=Alteromonas pelagimontana TaxID=1858656 RepID=A0A6M4MGT7_9ALTE|nr:S46 family peptidase [Alteromonas pelagimontana]QJR82329.1 S46 family peptidase [Alteromonas pelagimontana]